MEKLIVPPGHPAAGNPFVIPGYGQKFLRDVLRPGVSEGLICLGRKKREIGHRRGLRFSSTGRAYSSPWVQGWRGVARQGKVNRAEAPDRGHCRGVRVARPEVQAIGPHLSKGRTRAAATS